MAVYIFQPVYQRRIWGGQHLRTLFGREIPEGETIGESWELVDRLEAQSTGILLGSEGSMTLHELWTGPERGRIFGSAAPSTDRFPILIKILDATDKLSLQVHPDARLAALLKGEPKTEMWYFLHTEPDAVIYAGLKRGVTRTSFKKAVEDKTVAQCFHCLKVARGEAILLPSGRVHGIGAGNVIWEVQQNSDTTFRVDDWDRVDSSGKPRKLHVEQALTCIHFEDQEPTLAQPHGERLISTDFFETRRNEFFDKETREIRVDPRSFLYVFVSRGSFAFAGYEWKSGSSALFSADTGAVEVTALTEEAELLLASFPLN
ncbi:MAG: type I phosphomannose isomerase catalytic subunit [bacterium]